MTAPVAERHDYTFSHHGIEISDPYHWLKDSSYPDVDDEQILDYLRAENAYFDAYFSPLQGTVAAIYEELKARIEPDDSTVPVVDGKYVYQSRYFEGADYPIHVRWSTAVAEPTDDDVEVLIDEPSLAREHSYFRLRDYAVSNNAQLLAYGTDTDGSERYRIRIKDLDSGVLLADQLDDTTGHVVWVGDDRSFYYVVLDEQHRPYMVKRHELGSDPDTDLVIYEEDDPSFFVDVQRSTSKAFIFITAEDHVTSEVRYLPADRPTNDLKVFSKRRPNHLYEVDHQSGRFVIRTNREQMNFDLVVVDEATPDPKHWEVVLPGSNEHYIRDFIAFSNYIAVSARNAGLDQILLVDRERNMTEVEFPEPVYVVGFSENVETELSQLRLNYSSLVTPNTVFDYDMSTGELISRKVKTIPSGYERNNFESARITIKARDQIEIPVSLVWRKDQRLDSGNPLYLYGYGAYGYGTSPSFSTSIISLLDRGFIYAIAHVRGGDELGYHWYQEGKLDRRVNTFHDFIDAAEALIERGYTQAGKIAISGGSAGGSLVGFAANDSPELWGAVISHVPFVDILNTMLDDSLPLTPIEWPEWGNPITDERAFRYIRSYSPYDQIESQHYPAMLVTAGLNDPRVTYWEPAKYVAKLRHVKTDDNILLLRTEMEAGHGGKSGRLVRLQELAEEYAFLFHVLDVD